MTAVMKLFAVNYKWSNGTYLECLRICLEKTAFLRDVYIIETKKNHISDFLYQTLKRNIDGTYNVNISVDGNFDAHSKIKVTTRDEKILFEAELLPNKTKPFHHFMLRNGALKSPSFMK